MLNDWIGKTLVMVISNLDKNKFDYKKNWTSKRALHDSQIRSLHEMGKNDKTSGITSRWIFCTDVERTSWKRYKDSLHKYKKYKKEWIIYVNDSGEFHEVESNYRGNFAHVPSQPARIPSPSCDKTLATWKIESTLTTIKRLLLKTLLARESSQMRYQEVHPFATGENSAL